MWSSHRAKPFSFLKQTLFKWFSFHFVSIKFSFFYFSILFLYIFISGRPSICPDAFSDDDVVLYAQEILKRLKKIIEELKKEEEPEIEKRKNSIPLCKKFLRGDRSHINGWPRLHRRETRTDRQRYRQTDESDPSGSRPLFFILLKLKSREREKRLFLLVHPFHS